MINPAMKEIFLKGSCKAKEDLYFLTGKFILGLGINRKCMDSENLFIQMEENT